MIAAERATMLHGSTSSPTFLIDASEPPDSHGQHTGLGFRRYRQSTGRVSVLPGIQELYDALAAEAPTRQADA